MLKYISSRIHLYEYNKTSHTCKDIQNSLYYKTPPPPPTKALCLISELEHYSKNNSDHIECVTNTLYTYQDERYRTRRNCVEFGVGANTMAKKILAQMYDKIYLEDVFK